MASLTDPGVGDLREILWSLIMLGTLFYLVVFISITYLHSQIERKAKIVPARLKNISLNLKTIGVGLLKDNSDISGREKDQVVEEVKKISNLWKTRREQLQMGYWEKMEARAGELTQLQEQKEHLEELIKRTKVKYHKRELDEESFREIVKDYQKQLMEINVKIWELEKSLG
jgi:Fe2+ transport system protein B